MTTPYTIHVKNPTQIIAIKLTGSRSIAKSMPVVMSLINQINNPAETPFDMPSPGIESYIIA